ncbi:MAG: Fe-S cluster assembly protein SufD [Bacteroidaceae bacterium]|nr:Fe-S cluster assembly protein SufD [Bacteroidaceae bacterium]
MNSEQQYIDLFAENRSMLDTHSAPALNALRTQAFEDFRRQGFPSRKVERYRYTDVAAAFAPDYGVNLRGLSIPVNPYEAFRCDVPNLSTSLYFVANDRFYDTMPRGGETSIKKRPALPEGVIIDSLARVALERPELVAPYYGRLARSSKDAINALNTMLAQDGVFIYVPRHTVVPRPIQVVNILRADVPLMANRRMLIVLEEGAQLQLLVCDHTMDDHDFLATQVVEAFVGEDAHLEFHELEETHPTNHRFSNTYADLSAHSVATLGCITLSCGLTRNRTDVTLSGEDSEVNLIGAVVADGNQHADNNTLIDHRVPNCRSNELYKYVLDDSAVGAFAGRVLVREGAQKTSSRETNANLCAAPTARMYTQPMLEIYADDVKCSHGSTVGQLNDAALFYMRQRGVPEDEARLLLKFAFVGEVIDGIRLDALRDRLHYLVEKRFRGELGRCAGCGENVKCGER